MESCSQNFCNILSEVEKRDDKIKQCSEQIDQIQAELPNASPKIFNDAKQQCIQGIKNAKITEISRRLIKTTKYHDHEEQLWEITSRIEFDQTQIIMDLWMDALLDHILCDKQKMPVRNSKLYVDFLKNQECSADDKKKYTKIIEVKGEKQLMWVKPQKSPEGGTSTILYGHKLPAGEDKVLESVLGYSQSQIKKDMFVTLFITDSDAHRVLEKDLKTAEDTVAEKIKKMGRKMDDLNVKQRALLVEKVFNSGSLDIWPKYTEAVLNEKYDIAAQECTSFYKDVNGVKHEMERRNNALKDLIARPLSDFAK